MALRFDGTGYALSGGNIPGSLPTVVTLGLRIRIPSGNGNAGFENIASLVRITGGGTGTGIFMGLKFSGAVMRGGFATVDGTAYTEIGSEFSYTDDNVYTLFFESDATVSSEDAGFFVDENQQGSRSTAATRNPAHTAAYLIVGAGVQAPPNLNIEADIWDIFVCDYFLSSGEKEAIADGDNPLTLTTEPILYWPCDEDTGSTAEEWFDTASADLALTSTSWVTRPFGDAPATGSYSITAESGSFALSGTAAGLVADREIDGESGSLALTGTDATLTYTPTAGYDLEAESGVFSLTGTAATLIITLAAAAGSFSLDGTEAGLSKHYVLGAESGSFELSGTDAGLERGYDLTAESGSLEITGTDAVLRKLSVLIAEGGALDLTGVDAALSLGGGLEAESGSFEITGTDAGLRTARNLGADEGSFSLTGTDVALSAGLFLNAESGVLEITGVDASFTVERSIPAEAGSFEVSGTDAALVATRILEALSGTFDLTGEDAILFITTEEGLLAENGIFDLTGEDVVFELNVFGTYGEFVLTGTDATFSIRRGFIEAEPGSFEITESEADLTFNDPSTLIAESGSFELTGTDATLRASFFAAEGTFNLTGTDATLGRSRVMSAAPGSFVLTGTPNSFTVSSRWSPCITIPDGFWTEGCPPEVEGGGCDDAEEIEETATSPYIWFFPYGIDNYIQPLSVWHEAPSSEIGFEDFWSAWSGWEGSDFLDPIDTIVDTYLTVDYTYTGNGNWEFFQLDAVVFDTRAIPEDHVICSAEVQVRVVECFFDGDTPEGQAGYYTSLRRNAPVIPDAYRTVVLCGLPDLRTRYYIPPPFTHPVASQEEIRTLYREMHQNIVSDFEWPAQPQNYGCPVGGGVGTSIADPNFPFAAPWYHYELIFPLNENGRENFIQKGGYSTFAFSLKHLAQNDGGFQLAPSEFGEFFTNVLNTWIPVNSLGLFIRFYGYTPEYIDWGENFTYENRPFLRVSHAPPGGDVEWTDCPAVPDTSWTGCL